MVTAIESDVALVIAVMRLANKHADGRGKVRSIPQAIEVLTPAGVEALIGATKTFDFFERTPALGRGARALPPARGRDPARRRPALLARRVPGPRRAAVTSLLHDIGKLVLVQAYPGYPGQIHTTARTPEQRIHAERRELGIDHALVGGVMARRWGLPQQLAAAIEHHHAEDVDRRGRARAPRRHARPLRAGPGGRARPAARGRAPGRPRPAGPARGALRASRPAARPRAASTTPCPLSARELEVLKRLAEGKVYKQIALELGLSTSTVRTHLHNVYGKLGAVDRAQAVLIASERGWL